MRSASSVRVLLKEEGIRPNRRLGQNFLVSQHYISKIVDSCGLDSGESVVEIGPGTGVITGAISERCGKLIAVEFDKRLCSLLGRLFADYRNIEIKCGDILKFDFAVLNKLVKAKLKVIGNLPYYITSSIIEHLIDSREAIGSVYLTVQKEVARRLVAPPGSRDYGSLSCFVQFYTSAKILFYIPKSAFFPMPLVDSAFIKLEFLKEPAAEVSDQRLFFTIIRSAFNKRRKTLFNALSSADALNKTKTEIKEILSRAGIDPNRRAETLNLAEFARITKGFL